ncbi:hypothetical protein [Agaribacterium haliotis]|uniref:hypothetical protein n=1 Tax=Agaribacterium haliotis TaxID=2013869 RepID=UPI000BB55A8A|nr:hypothetical protein [Agaribacterium haliotis]
MKLKLAFVLLLSVLPCSQALAYGKYQFLNRSVFGSMSKTDADSLRQAVGTMLSEDKEQQVYYWNSEKDLQGKMKVVLKYRSDGNECRRVRFLFVNEFQKRERYQFDLCQIDGQWKYREQPLRYFNEQELTLMEQSIDEALSHSLPGEPNSWSTPERGSGGMLVPEATIRWQSLSCRRAALSIYDAKGRHASGSYVFCQQPDGQWQRNIDAEQELEE